MLHSTNSRKSTNFRNCSILFFHNCKRSVWSDEINRGRSLETPAPMSHKTGNEAFQKKEKPSHVHISKRCQHLTRRHQHAAQQRLQLLNLTFFFERSSFLKLVAVVLFNPTSCLKMARPAFSCQCRKTGLTCVTHDIFRKTLPIDKWSAGYWVTHM